MSAAEPTLLDYIAETIVGLLPWTARVRIDPATKALSIRSANETIDIDATERIDVGAHAKKIAAAGGGRGGVITTSDTGGKYAFDPGVPATTAPAMYYLPPGSTTPVLVTLLPAGSTVGGTVPPLAAAFGTAVVLGPGSTKVTVG